MIVLLDSVSVSYFLKCSTKIFIIGGRQGDELLDSIEMIDIASRTTHSSQDWKTSHKR